MGEMRNAYKILVGKPQGKIKLGPVEGSSEHGNDPYSFIQGGEFIDCSSDY
jgi:hypothetical protein